MKIDAPEWQLTATFLELGANYAMLLNQSNFFVFRFSSVSYCFAIKKLTTKHKMSEVMCTRQSRKVIWDMINNLFLTL